MKEDIFRKKKSVMSNEEMYPQTKKNVIKYYESIKDLENSA